VIKDFPGMIDKGDYSPTERPAKVGHLRLLLAGLSLGLGACAAYAVESPSSMASLPGPLAECASAIVTAWSTQTSTDPQRCRFDEVTTIESARLVQAAAVSAYYGSRPVIGHKITFAGNGNSFGEYREGMFVPSGGEISKSGFWRIFPEADMLLRVGDEAINEAASLEEALGHIDAILPFLEVSNPVAPSRSAIPWTMTNGSAGSGAVGDPVPVSLSQPDALARFMAMRVTLTDPTGTVVRDTSPDEDFLPALLDLRNEVLARGQRLRRGDLLSLGTFGRPVAGDIAPGTYRVTYHGIAQTEVTATAVITP
jgi:2-oxo-hept-3-ene-1,7-dioate hydratase